MGIKNKQITVKDIGLISYKDGVSYQENIFNETINIKIQNRLREKENLPLLTTANYLIFCEHPHVYTLGKSGDSNNLLINSAQLQEKNAEFYHTSRGGDITYHGPGQIVAYPILDLDNFFTDIHKYLRLMEESVILTLKDYGIESGRIEGLTGVWLDVNSRNPRKICAIGVKTSRWVTMHGLAFNVNNDLSYFNNIIPCGITDKAVTSMQKELHAPQNINEVKNVLKNHFLNLFQNDEK